MSLAGLRSTISKAHAQQEQDNITGIIKKGQNVRKFVQRWGTHEATVTTTRGNNTEAKIAAAVCKAGERNPGRAETNSDEFETGVSTISSRPL